jgi:hypothetical protein
VGGQEQSAAKRYGLRQISVQKTQVGNTCQRKKTIRELERKKPMIRFIKRLFCRHTERDFVRNIYGDEIIEYGWKRSIWRCAKCGKLVYSDRLKDN